MQLNDQIQTQRWLQIQLSKILESEVLSFVGKSALILRVEKVKEHNIVQTNQEYQVRRKWQDVLAQFLCLLFLLLRSPLPLLLSF